MIPQKFRHVPFMFCCGSYSLQHNISLTSLPLSASSTRISMMMLQRNPSMCMFKGAFGTKKVNTHVFPCALSLLRSSEHTGGKEQVARPHWIFSHYILTQITHTQTHTYAHGHPGRPKGSTDILCTLFVSAMYTDAYKFMTRATTQPWYILVCCVLQYTLYNTPL